MEPTRIVMMDLDPHTCPEDHGGRLTRLLRGGMSPSPIDIQTITHFPPKTPPPPPDLIFLRPSGTEDLSETVQFLRGKWSTTPIFGLFCTSRNTPTAVYQAFCNGLDDFLTCPLRDIDVFPRIQRLLEGKEATLGRRMTDYLPATK